LETNKFSVTARITLELWAILLQFGTIQTIQDGCKTKFWRVI